MCQDQALDTLRPLNPSPIIIDINCVNTLVYRTLFVDCPTSYSSSNSYITLGLPRHSFLSHKSPFIKHESPQSSDRGLFYIAAFTGNL